LATSAVAVSQEIARNFKNRTDLREMHVQFAGSVYLGVTGMYMRLEASRRGVKLTVAQGSFDNPLNDVKKLVSEKKQSAVVLAPFFDAITQEFEARQNEFSEQDIEYLLQEFATRWRDAIEAIPATSKALVLGLHGVNAFYPYGHSKTRQVLDRFNSQLRLITRERPGTTFVDMEALIYKVGLLNAIDHRMYYRARNPYTSDLSEVLAEVLIDALAIDDKVVKVLALDCDNTLWGGVLGEEGFHGIQIDPNTPSGAMYHEAQRRYKELKELGILVCLVSKNDESDVLRVLDEHEHQVLRSSDIIAHRINWNRKSENLASLAEELSLGLSSFVFVDDSLFECAEVSEKYPEICALQAPQLPNEYTEFLARLKQLCLAGHPEVGRDKTSEYRVRSEIETARSQNNSEQDFLTSLDVRISLSINSQSDISRLAEMFSKTNQFNTTTKRRTAKEVRHLMTLGNTQVISVRVSDRFVNHGLTALLVVSEERERLRVTDWLMSCRILGRGIERGIVSVLGRSAISAGFREVQVDYVKSQKNAQVYEFLESISSNLERNNEHHVMDVESLILQMPSWITID